MSSVRRPISGPTPALVHPAWVGSGGRWAVVGAIRELGVGASLWWESQGVPVEGGSAQEMGEGQVPPLPPQPCRRGVNRVCV